MKITLNMLYYYIIENNEDLSGPLTSIHQQNVSKIGCSYFSKMIIPMSHYHLEKVGFKIFVLVLAVARRLFG